MKKITAVLLAVCLLVSCCTVLSASAAEVSWTPVEISDDLKTEIYDAYLQYQYTQYVKICLEHGWTTPTLEAYREANPFSDCAYLACIAADDEHYIVYINPVDDFYSGIGYDRLQSYLFEINKHGGLSNVFVYAKMSDNWGFAPIEESRDHGWIGASAIDAMLSARMEKLAPFIYVVSDVNRDGKTTVSDVVTLRGKIVSGTKYSVTEYDIDGDGAVSVSDVIALREMIVA